MLKKFLLALGAVLGLLVLTVALVIGYIFGLNQRPRSGADLGQRVEQIADGITTVYLFELKSGKIVLIDAGQDTKGTAILDALKRRQKTPDDIVAIFITHAHPDHDAGVPLFPKAAVYALAEEVELAAGREAYQSPISHFAGKYSRPPFEVTHPLKDQETVTIEDLAVSAFAVPGHTPGSAAYLARGIVFLGDAASIGASRQLRGPFWLASRDGVEGVASLGKLLDKLTPRASEIEFVTSSHSGSLEGKEGLAAIQKFVEKSR